MKDRMEKGIKELFGFHDIGLKMLKLFHKAEKSALPINLLSSSVQIILPFISIYLSSVLIDHLVNRKYDVIVRDIIILISVNLFIGIISAGLSKLAHYKILKVALNLTVLTREKALSLDYEMIEDPRITELVTSTESTASWRGGMAILLNKYMELFKHILTSIIAVSMVGVLCLSKPLEMDEFSVKVFGIIAEPVYSVIFFLGIIIILGYSNIKLIRTFSSDKGEIDEDAIRTEHQLNYILQDVFLDYTKGKVIRLYSMEKKVLDFYEYWMGRSKVTYKRMTKTDTKSSTLEALWNGVMLLLSYVIVIIKVLSKAISIGEFTRYIGIVSMFNQSIGGILKEHEEIRVHSSYFIPLIKFMEMEDSIKVGSIPVEKRLDNVYEIEFHNVSFSYSGSSDKCLDNVSCKITLKDKIAIVGKNGAGKSTFIKLLCRLYDPTEGYITLNGVDIKKYNYQEYMNLFGVVFPDFSLFAYSICENISVSKQGNIERVIASSKKSGVYDKIVSLEQGMDTILYRYDEGGVELSGGESQKIAIARALYKDAPFVILDEPTAALDPISEFEIYQRFDQMVENKTSIYISHRMSSCRFCDSIYVFDDGKISEIGSHDSLIVNQGLYYDLWNAQAKYYVG